MNNFYITNNNIEIYNYNNNNLIKIWNKDKIISKFLVILLENITLNNLYKSKQLLIFNKARLLRLNNKCIINPTLKRNNKIKTKAVMGPTAKVKVGLPLDNKSSMGLTNSYSSVFIKRFPKYINLINGFCNNPIFYHKLNKTTIIIYSYGLEYKNIYNKLIINNTNLNNNLIDNIYTLISNIANNNNMLLNTVNIKDINNILIINKINLINNLNYKQLIELILSLYYNIKIELKIIPIILPTQNLSILLKNIGIYYDINYNKYFKSKWINNIFKLVSNNLLNRKIKNIPNININPNNLNLINIKNNSINSSYLRLLISKLNINILNSIYNINNINSKLLKDYIMNIILNNINNVDVKGIKLRIEGRTSRKKGIGRTRKKIIQLGNLQNTNNSKSKINIINNKSNNRFNDKITIPSYNGNLTFNLTIVYN